MRGVTGIPPTAERERMVRERRPPPGSYLRRESSEPHRRHGYAAGGLESFMPGMLAIRALASRHTCWTIQDSDRSCRIASCWISCSMSSGKYSDCFRLSFRSTIPTCTPCALRGEIGLGWRTSGKQTLHQGLPHHLGEHVERPARVGAGLRQRRRVRSRLAAGQEGQRSATQAHEPLVVERALRPLAQRPDRKSTRLNSSHEWTSYAVFCLKKKKDVVVALVDYETNLIVVRIVI